MQKETLSAEKGNFFTQEEIYDLLWKTVEDCTNIPEQLKRYVLKEIRKDDGALAVNFIHIAKPSHIQ